MKSLLNNKKYVILLSLAAFVIVGNTIYKQISDDYGHEEYDQTDIADPLIDSLQVDVDLNSSSNKQTRNNLAKSFNNIDWPEFPQRNPFQPYKTQDKLISSHNQTSILKNNEANIEKSASPLSLTAIIINKKSKYAVLNTQIIAAGDSIDGYTINTIYKDKIRLSGPNGPFTINLIEAKKDAQNEKPL